MKYMTVGQLRKACQKHPYILARFGSGYQMGINSKVSPLAQKRHKSADSKETEYVSFLPCSFMTYIEHKHPFL